MFLSSTCLDTVSDYENKDNQSIIEFQVFFDGDTNHLEKIVWRNNSVTDRRQFHCGPVTPYGGRDLGQHWFR